MDLVLLSEVIGRADKNWLNLQIILSYTKQFYNGRFKWIIY